MADQRLAKAVNDRSILTHLRRHGQATRADLARAMQLAPASVTRLTADLIARGLVLERPADPAARAGREAGRPGVDLCLNPGGAYYLGVEIGVTVLRLAVVNLLGQVAHLAEQPLDSADPARVVAAIAAQAGRLIPDNRFAGRIGSAVVTVPGLVTRAGHVVNLPIIGWRDLDLAGLLRPALPLPFTIANNAAAAAFGATYTRPELATPCTLFLKLGHGCGGAVVIDGRLFRGSDGTGMELGHLKIQDHGPRCSCGQSGCLETLVNLSALRSACAAVGIVGDDLPALVAGRAGAGQADALGVVAGIAAPLGRGLASLVNLLNPAVIVLGGLMRPVLAQAMPSLQADVAARIIPGTRMPDLVLSPLGDEECAIGAACIAHHAMMDVTGLTL